MGLHGGMEGQVPFAQSTRDGIGVRLLHNIPALTSQIPQTDYLPLPASLDDSMKLPDIIILQACGEKFSFLISLGRCRANVGNVQLGGRHPGPGCLWIVRPATASGEFGCLQRR